MDSKTEKEIIYTSGLLKKMYGHKNIIAMHTHPNSMPPSIPDFNSAYEHSYDLGIVVCHDGKIFIYTSEQIVRESLFDLMIAEYYDEHYNNSMDDHRFEFEAQVYVLKEIAKSYDIDFMEVV